MKTKVNNALKNFVRWENAPCSQKTYSKYYAKIDCCKLYDIDIVIGYNKEIEFYVAWNVLLHKKYLNENNYNSHSFGVELKREFINKFQNSTESLFSFYGKPKGFEMYEKVVVMSEDFLLDFCNDPFGYLIPNPNDKGYKKNTIFANPDFPEPTLISEFKK